MTACKTCLQFTISANIDVLLVHIWELINGIRRRKIFYVGFPVYTAAWTCSYSSRDYRRGAYLHVLYPFYSHKYILIYHYECYSFKVNNTTIYMCCFKTSGDAFRLPYSIAFGCSIRPFLELFHSWLYISHLSKFFEDGLVFSFP